MNTRTGFLPAWGKYRVEMTLQVFPALYPSVPTLPTHPSACVHPLLCSREIFSFNLDLAGVCMSFTSPSTTDGCKDKKKQPRKFNSHSTISSVLLFFFLFYFSTTPLENSKANTEERIIGGGKATRGLVDKRILSQRDRIERPVFNSRQ